MNHKELCELAVKWLKRPASRNGGQCSIAISETANTVSGEIPDAIGWRNYSLNGANSVLVEVKTSYSDFLADFKKPHRVNPETGMGDYRYYFAPTGIIPHDKIPAGWGLVEVNSKGHIKVICGHTLNHYSDDFTVWQHNSNKEAEMSTLISVLNRIADPQKMQDMLRESNRISSRLSSENERLRKENKDLTFKLYNLQKEKYE